jgi:hypothetical protein
MRLNPFESLDNEFDLQDILEYTWVLRVKDCYAEIFGFGRKVDYSLLIECINSNIKWHILTIGGAYSGDYWYFANYNNKFYFVDFGYGSCSGCDALLACGDNIGELKELQDEIKRSIREFDSLNEFVEWVIKSAEWWALDKDEILDYVKKEFNIDFDIEKNKKENDL